VGNLSIPDFNKYRNPIQIRVGNVLLHWTKGFPYDFDKNDTLSNQLNDFVVNDLSEDHPNLAKQIRKHLGRARMQPHEDSFKRILKDKSDYGNNLIFQSNPEEVANQLTLIDWNIYKGLRPSELLNLAWSKPNAEKTSPTVVLLGKRFNSVAQWVMKSILDPDTPKERAHRVMVFIEIAHHIFEKNKNFACLLALLAGLNKASVSRLKSTWKEVSHKSKKVRRR
jgi:hypothetical protein